jgi:hypothetical protein
MPRISHLVAATAFFGGLALAGFASAGDGHSDGSHREFGGRIDFPAIDTDGNGSLSRAELVTRASSRIATADRNSDGTLDRTELAAALPGGDHALIAVFATSPSEIMADRILAETGNTESGSVTVQVLAERQVNMLLAVVDTDRDAAISQAEADAMKRRGPGGRDGDRRHDMRRGTLDSERPLPPAAPNGAQTPDNG